MPATPTRIAFITEEYRRAVATTASAKTRHGTLARETDDPVETYLDDATDAQAIATARQDLLSPERRQFRLAVGDIAEVMALDYFGAVPVARYVDTESGVDRDMLVSEIIIDFDSQQAALRVWG